MSKEKKPKALCVWEGVAVGRQDLIMAGKGAGIEGLLRDSLTLPCPCAGVLGV